MHVTKCLKIENTMLSRILSLSSLLSLLGPLSSSFLLPFPLSRLSTTERKLSIIPSRLKFLKELFSLFSTALPWPSLPLVLHANPPTSHLSRLPHVSGKERKGAGGGEEFWREKQFGVGELNFTFSQNYRIFIGFLVQAAMLHGFNGTPSLT